MSITEALVKFLTTALTAKVAFRLIIIILSVVTTLHYLYPVLSKFINFPSSNDLNGGIITLLTVLSGVALGTLVFELTSKTYLLINEFLKSMQESKERLLEKNQENAAKAVQKEQFITNFKDTYSHLNSRLKYILNELLVKDITLNLDSENTRFLKRKGWVVLINSIPKNDGVFKIHYLIARELTKIIEESINYDISNLMSSDKNGCEVIINTFSHPNYHIENHEMAEADYNDAHAILSKCFYLNVHRDSLHIKWRENYKSNYERITKKDVRDYCEITLTHKAYAVGLNTNFRI